MTGLHEGKPQESAFVLPRTKSTIVRAATSGDEYRLDIAFPDGEQPAAGWPVLYLLDSTGSFGTCVEAVRRMGRRPDATGVSPLVVAGISSASGYDTARRQRDYTTIPEDREVDAGANGGAEAFLDFIENQIKPEVAARLPVDASRETLCGHSLAGFFALWALTERPSAFQCYAAISPSIWWDKPALLNGAAQLLAQRQRVFLTVGEWEDALPPWQLASPGSETVIARRAARRMVEGVAQVAKALEVSLGAGFVDFSVLPDEDHVSIVSTAIPRILRMASRA